MQRRVAMSAEKGAEKGDHECREGCREGDHECREG